jgi:predicted component of type VI protein secretion system
VAEAVSFTGVDDLTLDSETFKRGNRIAHARRELLEDGRVMRITQSGRTPDGMDFSNVSYYHRLD